MGPPAQSERPLRDFLRPLFARRAVVVLALVLGPAAALGATSRQQPVHEAPARVFPGQARAPGDIGAQLQGAFKAPDRAVKTQAEVAHSPLLAARVIAAVPAPGSTVSGFLADSTVTAELGGDILVFSVRDGDRRVARRRATEFARQYTLYRRRLNQLPIQRALAELRAAGRRTGEEARELQTLQTVIRAARGVVDPADAATQIRTQLKRNLFAGLLLGAIFGLGMAYLWEGMDNRVRSSREIEDALGLRELARVPPSAAPPGPDALPATLTDPHGREAEAFGFLRSNVLPRSLGGGARTIMVTSAGPGEGKSAVAANLAVALARAGRHVTLVDLDLRGASLARSFHLGNPPGVTDVVLGTVTLGEAAVEIPIAANGNGTAELGGALRVLTCGPAPPDAAAFHATRALGAVFDEIRAAGEMTVVNAAPLLGGSDAVVLARQVDCLLLVARQGVLRQPMLAELERVLDRFPADKLGFVLTDAGRER